MKLNNKFVLITGANRGIGKSIALTLAKKNFFIIGTASTEEGVQSINDNFVKNNLFGEGFLLNLKNKEEIINLISILYKQKKIPSILINNAGICNDNLLIRMKDKEWTDVIDVNLNSIFYLTKLCVKFMLKFKWGRIVNISSVIGLIGNSGQTNYAATKSAIIGFSKSLAKELAIKGITVNVVAPGFIDTDMTKKIPDFIKEKILKYIPMKKIGKPQHVANAVLFLISDYAEYITGETIHVNGGMYMC
ncbi:3-oxoacyl-[acyl-carrier-protein] reductase [Candidatus Legionella polyplacis]|nr:3-oxoacyl-[acyl-carrier-protein] reductase [Candidatus Legionella polyplacis]ATW01677.1 3-oxoacyl-[acyl-carrier-protein] reductase [Candidatus Legionella polyplacis]